MATTPTSVKDIKNGKYVMVEGEPCVVVGVDISKPGKHGSTKARIETMGIFDNKRRFLLKPTSDNVEVPIIEKKRATVLSVNGNMAQLMDMEDYQTFEALIPEELSGKIVEQKEVGYWKIENRVLIKEARGQ